MKILKNFNNNPNSSFVQVKIKPKSARGLFGASTVSDHHSVARPSVKISKGKWSQKGDRCLELAYSSDANEVGSDSVCHGETQHQPQVASLGYSGVKGEIKYQSD